MVQLECLESGSGCQFKTQDLDFDTAEKILDKHMDRSHPIGGGGPTPALSQPTQLSCPDCKFKTQEDLNNEDATRLLSLQSPLYIVQECAFISHWKKFIICGIVEKKSKLYFAKEQYLQCKTGNLPLKKGKFFCALRRGHFYTF